MVLQFIVAWLITKILVSSVGNEANGYYQMSYDFVNYAQIVALALNSMGSRFITMSYYNEKRSELNKYYNSLLYGNIILACALAIPMTLIALNLERIVTISERLLEDVKILFFLMFLNFLINVIGSAFSTATFVKNRIDLDSYRTIEGLLIRLGVLLVLFHVFTPHVYYVAIATLFGTVFVVLRNLYYTRILVPEVVLFKRKYFELKYVKNLISSGVWNSITRVGAILTGGLDLIVANQLVDSTAMGVLSISKIIPKYIQTACSTMASVFTPSVLINYAETDKKKMVKSIYESIKINAYFSVLFVTGMTVLGKRIYAVWVPSQDAHILQMLTIIVILGMSLLMPYEIIWSVFTATNKVKISSIYLLIESFLTVALEFTFLYFTDAWFLKCAIISGTSSMIGLIRSLTFLPLMGAWLLDLPYKTFYIPLGRVAFSYIIAIVISIFANGVIKWQGWIGLICAGIVVVLICSITSWFVLFTKEEKRIIENFILNKVGIKQKRG